MNWNLSENLRNTANNFPDQTAYIFENQSTTYAELIELVDRFADGLSAQGVKKGDTVALLVGNSPNFIISYYGIIRLGAVVVPMNPIYTYEEINYILSNSRAKVVIAQSDLESTLSKVKKHLKGLEMVIYTEEVKSEWTIEQLLQKNVDRCISPIIESEDLAVVLYTSGTTGKPKGAMLTHQNLASNADSVIKLSELNKEDRIIAVLPMFHVFSMTVCINAPIACGGTIIIIPQFSPANVIQTIRKEKATVFSGVPTMYNFMLQLPGITVDDFSAIRLCLSGGSSLPVEILKQFNEKFRLNILEGYGLSETSPVTAFNPLNGISKPGSVGVDIPGVKNKVVNGDGNEIPRGEVGELVVQGPHVMKGYFGMPEETASALKDGWFYTGDLAKMDEEGYIYIVDRKKDMILIGGYNVYPREVEEVLYQHPSIVEVAVIGIPNEEYGELVKAFIVKKEGQLTSDDIILFCQDKLAKYKIPREVEFVEELPRNRTGKVLRRSLRALSTASH